MTNLSEIIQIVENKWFNQLYWACKQTFNKTRIPSHDHEHHARVWTICKEILTELNNTQKPNYLLVEGCIIASFFHDTGLSINVGENHGKESRIICEKYFDDNKLKKPENFNLIVEAIEKHDDKEYKSKTMDPHSLLSILCAADDLDAFGRIGIIRYTEIYLLRGIGFNELPKAILDNLDKRFANFEQNYRFLPDVYKKYSNQYQITRDFFVELEKEIISSF
ncbi:MAG: HD domain-containing protein [Bacteroidales bacterium]|jgi:HD superfamily phosphodiesterase|nr:HD domain-containing protein [Bacteroidales bacterium]